MSPFNSALVLYEMTDNKRELILKVSAYGFIICVFILLLLSTTIGKEYGRFFY